jgi:hypothetical protein
MALNSAKGRGPDVDARSISRILYDVAAADGHSSRPAITDRLKRPTRKFGAPSRHALSDRNRPNSFPIWSCSAWGLPCPGHYCPAGALLPHLFTLTAALRPRRYILCGTFRPTPLKAPSRTLSGTLLCGVRTFLSLSAQPRKTCRSRKDSDHPIWHQLTYIIGWISAPTDAEIRNKPLLINLVFGVSTP